MGASANNAPTPQGAPMQGAMPAQAQGAPMAATIAALRAASPQAPAAPMQFRTLGNSVASEAPYTAPTLRAPAMSSSAWMAQQMTQRPQAAATPPSSVGFDPTQRAGGGGLRGIRGLRSR